MQEHAVNKAEQARWLALDIVLVLFLGVVTLTSWLGRSSDELGEAAPLLDRFPILAPVALVAALAITYRQAQLYRAAEPFVTDDEGIQIPRGLRNAGRTDWVNVHRIERKRGLREWIVLQTNQGNTRIAAGLLADKEEFLADIQRRWKTSRQ